MSTALALLCAGLGGCGQAAPSARTLSQSQRRALEGYLARVEPVGLAVNRLLDAADPILSAYGSARSTAHLASLRMGALERRFASYAVDIAAIEPTTPELRSLHAIYAHTFVLEDSYLSALTAGLAKRDLHGLPDTQAEQRAAIIQWRTGLTVLARRVEFTLPEDLQAAGRGEIAPSPSSS